MGVEAWATRSLSIAISQNPMTIVEKGNLEQDLAGEGWICLEKGPCRGIPFVLESTSLFWSMESAQNRALEAQEWDQGMGNASRVGLGPAKTLEVLQPISRRI